MEPKQRRDYLVVDDYGTGGIWIVITADSPESITATYPRFQVISPGELPWMTAEVYAEYFREAERFDLENPTGWLAEWGWRLKDPN